MTARPIPFSMKVKELIRKYEATELTEQKEEVTVVSGNTAFSVVKNGKDTKLWPITNITGIWI